MALLMPKTLKLSDGERHQLQKLIDKHKTPQQLVLRAKIILMASDGQNHREIARSLEINRQMAHLWRNRWLESEGKDLSILQRLQDRERVGADQSRSSRLFGFFVRADVSRQAGALRRAS